MEVVARWNHAVPFDSSFGLARSVETKIRDISQATLRACMFEDPFQLGALLPHNLGMYGPCEMALGTEHLSLKSKHEY